MKSKSQNSADSSRRGKPIILIYIALFAFLLWFDRFLKNIVTENLALGEAWPSADNFARILYTQNTGVSFGLFKGHPEVLIVFQTILFAAVIIAFIYSYRKIRHPMIQTALCWIACGGLGNLTDRFLHGYVIDYISVGSFPIWNLADMCIVGGCILLGIFVLFIYGRESRKNPKIEDDG